MPFFPFLASSGNSHPGSRPRDIALDALRTLAILGMMATHTTRLIPIRARWEINRLGLLLEPIIPCLFLALVGASLVLVWEKLRVKEEYSAQKWVGKQCKRAAGLWLIGVIFYCCENGFVLPDVFAAPGILGTIAYAIILLACLLSLPGHVYAIAACLALGLAAYGYLDHRGLSVFLLNQGNSPVFPILLFALAGALYARAGLAVKDRWPRYASFILWLAATGLLLAMVNRFGLEALFSKPFGRSDAGRVFTLTENGVTRTITHGYYNLHPVLSVAVSLAIVSLHQFFSLISRFIRPVSFGLLALGRHSLGVYILHLSLLAVAVVTLGKRAFPEAWLGAVVYFGLILICQAFALWRERSKRWNSSSKA